MRQLVSRSLAVLGGLLMLAALAAKLPALASAFLANIALLQVAAAPACDPHWYLCRRAPADTWYPPQPLPANEPALRGALGTLRRAAELDSGNRRARLHIAELQFALEDRRAAALTLAEAGWPAGPEPDLHANTLSWPAGSPLLTVGRYEYYLVRARQHADAGRWPEAVSLYRLALAYAGERALGQDARDFHLATATAYANLAEPDPATRLLAGKYYVLAGQGDERRALPVLESLLAEQPGVAGVQRAWAAFYLGRAYEALGEPALALAAYRQGWEAAPEVRQNGLGLARLLLAVDPAQAGPALRALEAAGPTFPAGRLGLEVDYRFAAPAELPSGWIFLGYDLDPESLEHGGPLEAWLWWRPPVAFAPGDLLVTPGGVALQPQTLTNLALNNAFEWGEAAGGLPLGWAGRNYTDDPDSLRAVSVYRSGRESRAAVAANLRGPSSGLSGLWVPVASDAWFLMAGWMRTQGAANSNLGRTCVGPGFEAPGPYFAAWPSPDQPDGVWVHIADLAPAYPGAVPEHCSLILINFENPGGTTAWDDLLFARILPPDGSGAP